MDPFDPAAVDPAAPGFLGQSPDFWRSMMQLGGNMSAAANARTAGGFLANGTGFAGPLGAATSATAQQMQELARTRSSVGLQNAQAQGLQMQNLLTQIKMPAAAAQAQIQQRLLTDPQFRQQFMSQFGVGGGDGSAQGGAPQPGAPQGQAAADGAIPPDQRGPMVAEAVKGTPLPVDLVHGLVGYESGWNPAAANKDSGAFGLGGILPSTARNPGFGMQPLPANATPQQQLKFSVDYLHARGKAAGIQDADWTNPAKVTAALAAYHGPTTDANGVDGSQYASNVQGRMKLASNGPIPMSGPAQAAAPQPSAQQPGGAPMAQGGGPMQASPPMAQGSPGGGPPPQTTQPDPAAMARADGYEKQANGIEMMRGFGVPAPGDPAALRQAAQQWRQYALAGATAGAAAAAKAPFTIQRANPGGVLYNANGQVIGSAPFHSTEVITNGANAGTEGTVLRSPIDGSVVAGSGSPAEPGMPGGFIPTKLGPQQSGRLKAQGEIEQEDITHDRTAIEGDLSHVLENVVPAKQQLFQLRSLIDSADPGAAGQFRADFKNWVQTFAPEFVSKITGSASPAQEFNKIALMGAGKQERGDLGARGGFRAIEMYVKANPNLDMQPTANHDMANALLISHQFHEDYATGATEFYNRNRVSFLNPQQPGTYTPVSAYDRQFVQTMRPELYASSISALNGKPYAEWSKGLTPKQLQVVGGILQRTDPNAQVDLGGHAVPVTAFKKVLGPLDIMPGGGDGR